MKAECHTDRRHKARGMCGSCYNRWLDSSASPETKQKRLDHRNDLRKIRGQKRSIHRHFRQRYGLSSEQYLKMFSDQNNQCAICSKHNGNTRGTKLYVDHNHITGKVRELLCSGCNIAIASIESNKVSMYLDYLKKHDKNALAALELYLRENKDGTD